MLPVYAEDATGDSSLSLPNSEQSLGSTVSTLSTDVSVTACEANLLISGELQVIVKATDTPNTYKLWKLSSGDSDYSLVCESKYPVLIYADYKDGDKYAVSVTSGALDSESERYEITNIRFENPSATSSTTWIPNILEGLEMVPNPDAPTNVFSATYGYPKLTDGGFNKKPDGTLDIHGYRFSTKSATDVIDATVQLGNTYLVNEVRIYDYTDAKNNTRAGDIITVYAYVDGAWIEAVKLNGKSAVLESKYTDTELELAYISLKLGYVAASALRVVCENDTTTEGMTVYEITASGILVEAKEQELNLVNVLEGKTFTGELRPFGGWASPYGYDKITDGSYHSSEGRFALQDEPNQTAVLESDLGAVYDLYELKIYDWCDNGTPRIKSLIVDVYYGGEWVTVVNTTTVPALSDRAADANGKPLVVSLDGVKAEKLRITCTNGTSSTGISLYEIVCLGKSCNKGSGNNVFLGKEFTGNLNPFHFTVYGYPKLTDGSWDHASGRFALKDEAGQTLVLESDLGGTYELYDLKLYDVCDGNVPRIKSLTVEVYNNGEWITVIDSATAPELNLRTADGKGSPSVFSLSGAKAQKVRITILNSTDEAKGISITEMTCSGVVSLGENPSSNAFEDSGKTVSVNGATASASSPLTNAFDGKLDTRYIVEGSASYVLELELSKIRRLYTLNVYDYRAATDLLGGALATRSDRTYVELYVDGQWIRVVDGASLSVDEAYTSFYLHGLAASKIRIGFNNTKAFDDGSKPAASVYEITCSTSIEISDRRPMLEAYEQLDSLVYKKEEHLEKMKEFYNYLSDFELHSQTISDRSAEMNSYYLDIKDKIVEYVPSTSITLGSEISVNVYMPVKDLLKFTLDGVLYEDLSLLADKKVTLESGEECYKMTILLPVTEAARDISLTAEVTSDTNDTGFATVSHTVSVPDYSAKVIKSGTDVEKALIRDVLSYVRAGYVYFDKEAASVEEIDSLIGTSYDKLSPFANEGSTSVPTGLRSATFNLKSKPALRFYLNDGTNSSDYSFKINGVTAPFFSSSDESGAFVEIAVYAYAMCETVECYHKGAYIGSYHIASYYNWALQQGDEELVKIVERFWKYCQSARDYKNQASVQINYVDESGNQLAEPYVNSYKPGESINVLSPAISDYYTRDVYLTKTLSEANNVFNVVYKLVPSNIDSAIVSKNLSNLSLWGDSITAGAMSSFVTSANQYGIDLESLGSTPTGGAYLNVLRNLITQRLYAGISIAALGVGGESTSTIAARADTDTYYLYLDGAVTISDSAVTVPLTHYSTGGRIGILRQGESSVVNPVTIVGKDASGNEISVTGTLTLDLIDGAPVGTDKRTCDASFLKYTFTRNDGKTDTLSFVSGARVITEASYRYDGRTCIIFMGENGGYKDVPELIKQQEEILRACGNPKYYLIISTTSGSNESRKEVREALTARWGEHYINMGDELNSSRKSYEFAGFPEEAILSVQENIANGTVTELLLADTCHPNAVGYAVIGNIIFERLFKLGAFDGVFDYYDNLNAVTTETFTYNGYKATVIRPANPNGKWIWKTEFLYAFDKAERTLVNDGYTRVYYEISNMYGNPEAVALMEQFYHEVISRYDLDEKCMLFGFSRGGLYAFNFALAYPQYVDKMYLDAPVLDLKTWPTKANNPNEFAGMLKCYGLTEETFADFKGSPIDKLEEFFALNIPLIVVAGDADATVPFEENAGTLINYALANGHPITYYVEEGKDHHPHSLTDVTPIVEFCKRGSYENIVSDPLTKQDFSGKTITFLGDSITQGVGVSSSAYRYSSLLAASLGMKEINMGISGTVMCTGGHRDSRLDDIQNISLDSDYVGILLGVNDFDQCVNNGTTKYYALGEFGSTDTSTVYGALDKMCSDLVARFGNTSTKVFLMTPVVTSWNSSVSSTKDWDQSKVNACGYTLRELCDAIVEVATYYGIVTLDLNSLCEMSETDFADGIHPNTNGTAKMAAIIEEFLLANYSFE